MNDAYLIQLAQSMAPSLDGGKTGWPAGMLQDDCRPLSRWLANRVDSRMHAREVAQAIADETREGK